MLHLAECRHIDAGFWQPIRRLLLSLGLRSSDRVVFLVLGKLSPGKYVDKEEATVLFLAWRCLYAEVVGARLEGRQLNLKRAYARTIRLLISRLKANGTKWHRWYSRTRYWRREKVKLFPERFRQRKLVVTTPDAEFTVNPTLLQAYESAKSNL